MRQVSTTVTKVIAKPKKPLFAWFIPVVGDELHTVLKKAAMLPGVERTTNTTGPWDVPGSNRTIHLTDGSTVHEEVTAGDHPTNGAPGYFAYRVTEFTNPIRFLVKEARGQWWFTDDPGGTHVKWTYSFVARFWPAVLVLLPLVKILWSRYMAAALAETKRRAEAEVEA